MKTMWSEYAGILLGAAAIVMLSRVVILQIVPGGIFYEAVIGFLYGIC